MSNNNLKLDLYVDMINIMCYTRFIIQNTIQTIEVIFYFFFNLFKFLEIFFHNSKRFYSLVFNLKTLEECQKIDYSRESDKDLTE